MLNVSGHSRFSQTHKVGNVGIIVNFVTAHNRRLQKCGKVMISFCLSVNMQEGTPVSGTFFWVTPVVLSKLLSQVLPVEGGR